MPTYRCYFLNSADQIVGAATLICVNDDAARHRAEELLRNPPPRGGPVHSVFEMWLGRRCVYRTPAPSWH